MLISDMIVREGITGDLACAGSVGETLRWVRNNGQNIVWVANDLDLHISIRCASTWICTVYPSGTMHFNPDLVGENWDYSLRMD